jgi:hypothetical protein
MNDHRAVSANFFVRFLILTAMLALAGMGSAGAQESESAKGPAQPVYRFSEHLEEAEASIVIPDKGDKVGQWNENRFSFGKLASLYDVQIVAQSYDKKSREAITVKPIPETIRRLRFRHVPPGSKMVVYYGFPDEKGKPAEAVISANVYLNIWAGKHRLVRLIIPYAPGWTRVVVPLEVIDFLLRDYIVTFDVLVDEALQKPIGFDAEVLP